jgi:hypothetical protein
MGRIEAWQVNEKKVIEAPEKKSMPIENQTTFSPFST